MKVQLMYADRDFDPDAELPANTDDLTSDLGLDTLWDAMADGDDYLRGVARTAVLTGLAAPDSIAYRQDSLDDCLREPDVVRQIYQLAVDSIKDEKQIYYGLLSNRFPEYTLRRSVDVLELFVGYLKQLRQITDEHGGRFGSDGFTTLFTMLGKELSDDYFVEIDDHLKRLKFRGGMLISARLGEGMMARGYVLRRPSDERPGWWRRLFSNGRPAFSFTIPDRDEAGSKALADLRARGINAVANAMAQSTDHILSFFQLLRAELGFYVGCLNLRTALATRGGRVCRPQPALPGSLVLNTRGLYEACLRLRTDKPVVGNDLAANGTSLVMITGANQGGKSTFLRALGLAHVMMAAGMFVAADSFDAAVPAGVFTHFKREEDATMESGKLDEELARMSGIADAITANDLLLGNESFSATNEREGSEIARQILRALQETGVRVLFVTHLYDLAHTWYQQHPDTALFLRAEREEGGRRTFQLKPEEPLETSYGQDLYRQVFGSPDTDR